MAGKTFPSQLLACCRWSVLLASTLLLIVVSHSDSMRHMSRATFLDDVNFMAQCGSKEGRDEKRGEKKDDINNSQNNINKISKGQGNKIFVNGLGRWGAG
ncbi:hypothetical protein BDV41DRAFT_533970 [Aspergillus transmontanensis]|uniref:Uncharacterized protein n=1 Tax=Aspergillus transmontanensis TaxID=1034304 RepID=A0A5N6W158_9EURO|nr:hypothetical protein BDV41DRAFT_533970 [Aspergillus transmontanensis]